MKRQLANPKIKKEPVTLEMLRRMADDVGCPPTLTESRLLAMCCLAFAAFLRYEELAKLRCCDVRFEEDHLVVTIRSSKTDQYREGAEVVVARSDSSTCPVERLKEYTKIAAIVRSSSENLFRAITKTKKGEKLRKSGTISYTRVRELVLDKFAALGYDTSSLGLHSFWAGGAMLAANVGVPDRMFKRHGRCRSESAKDGYVKDTLEARLEVSKSLGM